MTLEELKQRANSGDIKACNNLGSYYFDNKDLDEAEKWYEMAAQQGDFVATHLLSSIGHIKGLTANMIVPKMLDTDAGGFALENACEDWEKAYKWALKDVEYMRAGITDFNDEERKNAYKNLHEAEYHLATYKWLFKDHDSCNRLLSTHTDTRSLLLQAVITGMDLETEDDARQALYMLETALNDSDYKNVEKSFVEKDIYNIAQNIHDELKNLVASFSEPNNSRSQGNKSGGGCYVATAVYGSYDCPEVWTLRRFRDYKLSKTWYGRTFIKLYYATSPTVVKLFGNKKLFNVLVKGKLDKMVDRLKSKGYNDTPYND